MPDDQVARTVRIMGERASADAGNPEFQAHAAEVFAGVPAYGILFRAFDHVKSHIQFQRDEATAHGFSGFQFFDPNRGPLSSDEIIEVLIRPLDMARYIDQGIAIGDCDDFVNYLAALLMSQGIACRYCTVAADDRVADQFSHIYTVAYPNGGERIPMDASHGDYPGWEVPNKYGKLKEWPTDGGCSLFSLAAFAGIAWLGWKMVEAAG